MRKDLDEMTDEELREECLARLREVLSERNLTMADVMAAAREILGIEE